MKPVAFKYHAPMSLEEALTYLSEYGWDAKVLAGGQSLIPMMNFRLARPSVLIDINNIPKLSFIRQDHGGGIQIGAMTRYFEVEDSFLIAKSAPMVSEAMPHIGTLQVRSRGTFGGSIAHADPSAELAAVSVALDGRFHLKSKNKEREVPADKFFKGLFTTIIEPEELLVQIDLPPMPKQTGSAFIEIARRANTFALAGTAVLLTLDKNEHCKRAVIVLFSVGDRPVKAKKASAILQGETLDPETIRGAAEAAATDDIDPGADIHASAKYRRHLVKVIVGRALEQALKRAKRGLLL